MNLFEFAEKARLAKVKATEFQFKDTAAYFAFRPLRFDELTIVSPFAGMTADTQITDEQLTKMVGSLGKMVDAGLLTGWRGLTIRLFEEISGIDCGYAEEEKDQLLEFNATQDSQEQTKELSRMLAHNQDFAVFMVTSVAETINQQKAQKKT